MLTVSRIERKESIKIYKKIILVIQFKSPKFSFLYKIGEIKKTNCNTIGTSCAKSENRRLIKAIIKGNQNKKINRFKNGIHDETIRL